MGKLGTLKIILKAGTAIGKPFMPKGIGSILDEVNKSIEDKNDANNVEALRAIAAKNDEQDAAMLIIWERLNSIERTKK